MPDKIITEALERFDWSQSGSSYNREAYREDIRFARLGEQWPPEIANTRRQEGRPVLVINRLPSFIRQVVNDGRQNSPSIEIVPVDSGADPDTAEIIGGIVRGVERGSNANVAYDTSLEHAVSGGFGFFRITTDYCHAESFDMEARIERVANPLSVYWDTSSQAFDASDWGYAFVVDDLTQAEFKARYPKAKAVDWEGGVGDQALSEWLGENTVRIAEYWLRVERKRKLVLLSNGAAFTEADLKAPIMAPDGTRMERMAFFAGQGITPTQEREATYHTVTRREISGVEVLSETEWPGSMIPICPVWGEEVIYEGRRHFRSLVRDAMDPQRMFNFWRSASTELVALAPRAPFIVQEGSIPDGAEGAKWKTANTRSHAYLTFRGNVRPERQAFAGVPAGAIQEALNAADDMKAIMGIYDASLGARSNETSGRAIMARQREGDNATFHYIDNLSRAIQYAGRCLVEIIPAIYTPRQAVQILGPDQAAKVARLVSEGDAVQTGPDGGKLYNLNVGKYDVTVKTGPSYATAREATREALVGVVQAAPDLAPILADEIVRLMDFPGAEKASRRLKAMLPPQALAAENEGGDGMPPEAAMMVQQAQQQVQALQAQLAEAAQAVQDKQAETQIKGAELSIKSREVAVKEGEAQTKAAEAQARLMQEARALIEARQKAEEDAAKEAEDDAAEEAMQQQTVETLNALGMGLQQVMQGQQMLAELLAQQIAVSKAPKRLVRDENGRPAGAEVVL